MQKNPSDDLVLPPIDDALEPRAQRPVVPAAQDEDEADADHTGESVSPEEAAVGVVMEGDVHEEVITDEDAPAALLPDLDATTTAEVQAALIPGVLDETAEIPKAKTQQVPNRWIQEPLRPEDLYDKGSI